MALNPLELPELLEKIFERLELSELCLAERVSRAWLAVARTSPFLEKTRFRRPDLRRLDKAEAIQYHPYLRKNVLIGRDRQQAAMGCCQLQRKRMCGFGTQTSEPPHASEPHLPTPHSSSNTTAPSKTDVVLRDAPATLPASSTLHLALSNDSMLDLIAHWTSDEDDCCERCQEALDEVVDAVQDSVVVVGKDGFVRVGQVLDEVSFESLQKLLIILTLSSISSKESSTEFERRQPGSAKRERPTCPGSLGSWFRG